MSSVVAVGSMPEVPSRFRSLARLWPECAVLLLYVCMISVAIPFHEPWSDEAQAWQIARNISVPDLFLHAVRYEGSPGLWYLLLHMLSRLHVGYAGMQWFAGGIGTVAAALLIFLSPFPRWIRLALPFTFFLAFQYAVVARSYVLVPLLLFAIAAVWRRGPVVLALLLGLMGNVATHALAVSAGFAVLYLVELRRGTRERPDRRTLLQAGLLLAGLYGIAVCSVFPIPKDLSFAPHQKQSMVEVISLWPFRGTILMLLQVARPFLLSVALCGTFLWLMARRKALTYLIPIGSLAAIGGLYCAFWHAGLEIPTMIAICWILYAGGFRFGPTLTVMAAFCILLQMSWTAKAIVYDHYHAYSPDLAAARWLASHVDAGETMALTYLDIGPCTEAYTAVGLFPYLPKLHFLNERRQYWLWSTHEHTEPEFVSALHQHPSIVVVEYWDFKRFEPSRDLTRPPGALLAREGYHMTRYFCGQMTRGSSLDGATRCHLIFER